jgi:SAM-dependent methyltransferase
MDATGRFRRHASAYDAGRPVYPVEAIDLVFAGMGEPARLLVADLGAGTGISSRMLAQRGARVFAVEPNAAMRAKSGPLRDVTWVDASAERTGLASVSVDIVTAFQAFHWFDRDATFAEIARIVRPRGRAVAVYYERDESDRFTKSYGDVVREFAVDATEQRRTEALDAFERWSGWASVRRTDLPSEHVLDAAGLRDRARSTSYLPHGGPRAEQLTRALDELLAAYAVAGSASMRLVTTVAVAELP